MRGRSAVSVRQTPAYGLWEAVVVTDWGTFTGSGLSEYEASYRARVRAREAREGER